MELTKLTTLAIIGAALVSSMPAVADNMITITANWSGAPNGNTAMAVATFDMDITAINIGLNANNGDLANVPLNGYITNLTLTVSGATSGNGTFTTSDFSGFYFTDHLNSSSNYDFDFSNGGNWVTNISFVDFNLMGQGSAPYGSAVQQFEANHNGDNMNLVSAEPTPEPGTLALAALGGVGALFFARRKK